MSNAAKIQSIRGMENRLMAKIDRYSEKAFGPGMFTDAWLSFIGWEDNLSDPNPIEMPESGNMCSVWRQFHWQPEQIDEGENDDRPTEILALSYQHKRPIDVKERDFIKAAMAAPYCFYQIVSVVENQSMRLKNLFTDELTQVIESQASRPENVGDMLFTTLVNFDNAHFLLGTGCYAFEQGALRVILTLKQRQIENSGPWSTKLIGEYEAALFELYWAFREELFKPPAPVLTEVSSQIADIHHITGHFAAPDPSDDMPK